MNPELAKKLINKYGIELQMIVAIEEASEFQKELCKFIREQHVYPNMGIKVRLTLLAEEIADLELMLYQIKQYFGEGFQKMIDDFKVKKTLSISKKVND